MTDADFERMRLAEYIGMRENAEALFAPRVHPQDITQCGLLLLDGLGTPTGTNWMASEFKDIPDEALVNWASRCWANTVAHLAEKDSEVVSILKSCRTCIPDNAAAQHTLIQKVHNAWRFFLWIYASPQKPRDINNQCQIKIIVLEDVILLEGISAQRNGNPGRWGVLDKCLVDLKKIAAPFGISAIKTIATNERVHQALLKRGMTDQVDQPGMERLVENYSKPMRLLLGTQLPTATSPHR